MSKIAIDLYETAIFTLDYAIDTAKSVRLYHGTIDDIINQLENAKTRREKDLERIKEELDV